MANGIDYGKMKRCYETHPPLKIGNRVIYGGNCGSPIIHDADIYIGFERGMKITPASFPWNRQDGREEILFYIADQHAPSDAVEFNKLVRWTLENLSHNKKIHAGCIGGHGRTGMFFAALVSMALNERDAITYVRENYCKKAVETEEQINFLHHHYNIKKVSPSKPAYRNSSFGSGVSLSSYKKSSYYDSKDYGRSSKTTKTVVEKLPEDAPTGTIHPLKSNKCIF